MSIIQPINLIPLITSSTIFVVTVFSTFTSLMIKDSFYLNVLREYLIYLQSILIYIQLDKFFLNNHTSFRSFYNCFNIFNGNWYEFIYFSINPEVAPTLYNEESLFWNVQSHFLPKIGLFIVLACFWELSFGWSSYVLCFLMRERVNAIRKVYNYIRYWIFSIFFVWLLFPIVSLLVRPLFFSTQIENKVVRYIYMSLSIISLIYIGVKLFLFWFDIFIHWIDKNHFTEYQEKTASLSKMFSVIFTREYYQIRGNYKLISEIDPKQINPIEVSPIPNRNAEIKEAPKLNHSKSLSMKNISFNESPRKNHLNEESISQIKSPIKQTEKNSKSKINRKSKRILPFIIEPLMLVLGLLRTIFIRPSILLKLFIERHENNRNFAIRKLPKQNLHGAYGVAIKSYREGDDSLYFIDSIIFRVLFWIIINASSTLFFNLDEHGEKYRFFCIFMYHNLYILYYIIHLPQNHWYDNLTTLFFNGLTSLTMIFIGLLTFFPNFYRDVFYWIIFSLFIIGFLYTFSIWIIHNIYMSKNICFSFKLKNRKQRTIEETNKRKSSMEISHSTPNLRIPGLKASNLFKNSRKSDSQLYTGVISHLDMVEVLETAGEETIVFDSPYGENFAEYSPQLSSSMRAGLAEAKDIHDYSSSHFTHPPSIMGNSNLLPPIDPSIDERTFYAYGKRRSSQDMIMIQHERTYSDSTDDLKSIPSDDENSLKYSHHKINENVLLTPRDEDLKPATFKESNLYN